MEAGDGKKNATVVNNSLPLKKKPEVIENTLFILSAFTLDLIKHSESTADCTNFIQDIKQPGFFVLFLQILEHCFPTKV